MTKSFKQILELCHYLFQHFSYVVFLLFQKEGKNFQALEPNFRILGVQYNFVKLMMSTKVFQVHFLDAFVCAAVIVFIVMLVPKTKGRTLEEIQASMN